MEAQSFHASRHGSKTAMTDATDLITIRFSRAAPPNMKERLRDHTLIDYSEWICRLTHSPFSHVDYLIDLGRWDKPGQFGLLGASNNPNAPFINGNPSGVAVRPIEYQRFAVRRDANIWVTPADKTCFEGFCVDQLGKPFDSSALKPGTFLSRRFDRDWRADSRWFCAEMIGRGIEKCNVLSYEYPGVKNRMTAADLLIWLSSKINFAQFYSSIPHLPVAGDWET